MPRSTAPKDAEADQIARFVETARALGCNEDPATFDKKMKVIARHKPKQEVTETASKIREAVSLT